MSNQIKNVVVSCDLPNKRTRNGDMHSASYIFTDVAAGGYARVKIKNTSSNKEFSAQFFLSHNVKCYLQTFSGTTYTDEGTSLNIWNRKIGVAGTEIAEVKHTPTIDVLGELRLSQLFPGSTSGSKLGGVGSGLTTFIPPGEELLMEVQNKALQADDFSVVINWFEQDIDLVYSENT